MSVLAMLINVFVWAWIIFQIKPQEELIFLHYNILFGVDYVGEWWRVYYLPLTGLFIFITNFFISWLSFHKDKFISIIFQAINLVCQIFLLIAVALLMFLNV